MNVAVPGIVDGYNSRRCSFMFGVVNKFRASIEPMHPPAQGIAGTALSRSHSTSAKTPLHRSSLHAGKRFADIEAKASIQGEQAVVKRGFCELDSGAA